MPTECSADLFGFAPVEGRRVEAAFDGGVITSDAGALLLGAADRAIGLVGRFAACFADARRAALIEHAVATLVGQRVFALALGYEDLNDHDQLRHDPAMAVLAGKLGARRSDCAPVAGKSRLNRLELSRPLPTRYHKISHDPARVERLFVDVFLEAHARPPKQIVLDLDATDDPVHGHQEGRFFHGYYDGYCYLPLYIFCGRHLLAAKLRRANIDASAGAVEETARIVAHIRARWPAVEPGEPSKVTLGGINLGIGAYSKNPELAFDAAECLASPENQIVASEKGGLPPTDEALYDDPKIRKANPFADELRTALDEGVPRPVTPAYTDISLAIQKSFHPPDGIDPETVADDLRDKLDTAAEGGIF